MSSTCSYCPPDNQYEGWGFSPEGWQQALENHNKYHICKKCKQVLPDQESVKGKNGRTNK